jgi:putative glycosyltransferase (TIGR04372 family)
MLLNMAKIYRASCRVLDLNSLENQQAQSTLKKFGVLPADKVVCLHVRDAEYLDKLSRKDFSYHDYRDVDIQSYELAVKYLIDKGFKVIRIGVSSNQVLNIQTPSYLDMTQFSADDERALAEIYLIRNCVFYIGTTSGPASVAAAFDTPTLLVNTTPIWHHYGLKSRSIFKFIQRENQTLNFIDIANGLTITDSVDKKIIDCFDGHELDKNDLRYIDNTQEDILAAVVEFESLVLNDNFDMELTSLQQEYLSKIPSNHGLLAGPGIVANSFLEIHRSLFHIP